eukprot:3533850-Prymnesium_polylepis.1
MCRGEVQNSKIYSRQRWSMRNDHSFVVLQSHQQMSTCVSSKWYFVTNLVRDMRPPKGATLYRRIFPGPRGENIVILVYSGKPRWVVRTQTERDHWGWSRKE